MSAWVIGRLAAALALCLAVPASVAAQTPAALGVGYTLSVQRDDGLFRYEYDFLAGEWSTRDNAVRQAGTSYALALFYEQSGDAAVRAGVQTALDALAQSGVDHGDGRLLSKDGSYEGGNPGATALAFIAALLTEGPSDRAEAWLRGLVALQRPDGRIGQSPVDDTPNGYYDGETWLAFAYAAGAGLLSDDPGGPLRRADRAMVTHYGENPGVGFFHWGQLAARLRHDSTGDPELVDFSAQQVAHYLGEMRPRVSDRYNQCAAVEGLTAAHATLAANPMMVVLREGLERRVSRLLRTADALQIKPGATRIEFRDGVFVTPPEIDRFAGAFLNGRFRPQARIDTTQHCIAAFLAAEALGLDGWKAPAEPMDAAQ